ncbi:uroporphyrinogen-III synthase [Paracoccus endophyticus]|uniref:uroporphyrinogen-III synthase n=1 Tax=Paracoccus endophyticus TaxID=2233774 RepID=UPI000DD88D79|nr:uroporphyrinogen-III synthase [Paracoccus endophyticus]
MCAQLFDRGDPMPVLLITRPEAAAGRLARDLAGLGLPTIIAPLMRIDPVPHNAAALDRAAGLVFTSENGVAFAGTGGGRPAICVGPRTALAAEAAGFEARTGPGDAAGLMPMLQDLGPGWLHVRGAHVAADLGLASVVVYDQTALPLTAVAAQALAGDAPVILPLFSPRSARLAAAAVAGARAPLWLAPISIAADAAFDGPAARRVVAATPDAPGVVAAVEALCTALA